MPAALDIAIVGYGTAGQAAALFLERDGHAVTVFERVAQPGPVGAGVLLQPTGLAVLADLGLLQKALACGAVVERLHGLSHRGRHVMDMRYRNLDARYYGLGMQRGALFSLLRDAHKGAAAVKTGCAIVALEEAGRYLRDAGGARHGSFDVVVVADGAASCLRGAASTRRDRPYPWGALWCLCPDPDARYSGVLHQRYRLAREMIGVLPVGRLPDEADAARRISFFWSLRHDAYADWCARGVADWKVEVGRLWPEAVHLLEGVESPEQMTLATYRDAVLQRFHAGRVAWIGDAAHSMSPQLGQGVNMALCDAFALAQALHESPDVEVALAQYDRARRGHIGIYQFMSRWLTPLFQSDLDSVARLRDWLIGPLGKLPLLQGDMLRILSGTKRGLFGRFAVDGETIVAPATSNATSDSIKGTQ